MQSFSWQQQLARALNRPQQLLDYVGLPANSLGYSEKMLEQFPVRVPHAYADRIAPSDPDDPLLRQVFPYIDEEIEAAGFVHDPLAENVFQPAPGLIQKYQSRVLAITTGACAIHCRYCFRRHFPYQEASVSKQHWQKSLSFIEADKTISEVILSGGDPLTLSDEKIIVLCQALASITHVQRIRFHTRVPVVLPARLSKQLIEKLTTLGKSIVFVMHINHANEIDEAVAGNIQLLQQQHILVLNQSVLLKGVNDSTESLIALSEQLVRHQVTPYYLHLLDPVSGAAHYQVSRARAQSLIVEMQNKVSGYLVPRLVMEEIGAPGKTHITDFD